MCDGTYRFNRKGLVPIRPRSTYTLVITSNRDPSEIYGERPGPNGTTLESRMPLFEARFRILNPENDMNIKK